MHMVLNCIHNTVATLHVTEQLVEMVQCLQNILHRDFTVNGTAVCIPALYTTDLIDQFTTNYGFMIKIKMSAHWICSYFLGNKFLCVPSSPEEAFLSME